MTCYVGDSSRRAQGRERKRKAPATAMAGWFEMRKWASHYG